jgi:hypothetical protein
VLNQAMLNHPKVVRFKEVMLTPKNLAVISEVRQLPPPFLGGFATVATNHHACASSHRRDHLISHPRAS